MAPLFFFGAMSPYSWFAAERIGALLPEAEWRPVFAGGLFKAAGRSSWGLDERRGAGLTDCEARTAAHGLGPIRWPDPWPTLDVGVARAMLMAQHRGALEPFALTAMRAAFLEGQDLGRLEVIDELWRRAGLEPVDLERELAAPEHKVELREATDAALALGVFGVPTVVVGERVYWGDDRLAEAATAAR